MSVQRLLKALKPHITKIRDERISGVLGRTNADGSVTILGSRQDYVIVTFPNGTMAEVLNKGQGRVPLRAGLPVTLIRLHNGALRLDGQDDTLLVGDPAAPGEVTSVNGLTGDVTLDTDDIAEGATNLYYTAERARDDIGTALVAGTNITITVDDGLDTITIDASVTAAVDSVNGQTGVVVLDQDDVGDGATYKQYSATEQTKLAGIETAADVTDAGNIASSITGVSTDDTIIDADVWGYLTGGALVKTAWSNIKAVLKTYFDTLYNLYVHPNHTGDVTSVGDGATTIANDAVSNAKLRNSGALSVIGRSANSSGDPADISAVAASDSVLRESGSTVGFGTVAAAGIASNAVTTAKILDANVTLAKLANIATDSLIGRDTALSGVPENITLGASLEMSGSGSLQRAALTGDVTASANSNATAIGTNKVLTAMIADAQITLAKMANLAADTIIGRANGAGTGVPTALSAAQVVAIIQATLDGRYGQLGSTNTWTAVNTYSAQPKFDAGILLSPGGTQDYAFGDDGATVLTLESQNSGALCSVGFITKDFDGTDSVFNIFWAVGKPTSATNRERLIFGYNAANLDFEIQSEANGTGTLRPIILFTEGNTNQLRVDTDGYVGIMVDPAAQLDVLQGTLGSAVQKLASTATNDDPTEIVYQNRVATTGNTATTIHTFAIPASTTVAIHYVIVARRTGGVSGAAEDSWFQEGVAVYKNVAGTATAVTGSPDTISVANDAGWGGISFNVSGANVQLQVTGATTTNITWHMTARVYSVGS